MPEDLKRSVAGSSDANTLAVPSVMPSSRRPPWPALALPGSASAPARRPKGETTQSSSAIAPPRGSRRARSPQRGECAALPQATPAPECESTHRTAAFRSASIFPLSSARIAAAVGLCFRPRHRHVGKFLARRRRDDQRRVLELRAVQREHVLDHEMPRIAVLAVFVALDVEADRRRSPPRASHLSSRLNLQKGLSPAAALLRLSENPAAS